jgi:RNA polymerase sigma-70 factor (ECF subfamily)
VLAVLREIPPADVASYQPYWALRGHLLAALGRAPEARDTYPRAEALD